MKRLGQSCLIVLMSACLFEISLFAQQTTAGQEDTSVQSQSGQPPSEERSAKPVFIGANDPIQAMNGSGEQQEQYVPALDGSGLIPMNSGKASHMMVGAAIAGGWDSNPENVPNAVSSGVYMLSPLIGVHASTPNTQFILQYMPTITRYTSNVYSGQTMNVASVAMSGKPSERWSWDIKGMGSYGQDSIRFLAPTQTVAVGGVPGTGANAASYLPNAGTVTYMYGSGGLSYRKSERDSIEMTAANTFSHYTGVNGNNSIASTSLKYNRGLSPTLSVRVYGQTYYYYGALNCNSFGGGFGVTWNAADRFHLSVNGGPQLNTSSCGQQQGFAYNAAFSARLTHNSQLYMLAAREPTVSYLGPGLWLESGSGGYQRQVGLKGDISFDIGYVKSDTLTATSSYNDVFLDCSYSHQLSHGLNLSSSFRRYSGSTNGSDFSRNVLLFSLGWAPTVGHIFQ
jgi:hypothetical protein